MGWRDQILREFVRGVARLTLVADPDDLLLGEDVLHAIRQRGFDVVSFDDPIAFRFVYESRYRSRWDRGEPTDDLVLAVHGDVRQVDALPFDVLQIGRRLSFSLRALFPSLDAGVVRALAPGDLDALYRAQEQHRPGRLGENATKDFVLRYVFFLAPDVITTPAEVLRVLLRRHHQTQRMPASLDDYFVKILRKQRAFDEWPLEQIVPDRDAFLGFLQERWPLYLDRLAGTRSIAETPMTYGGPLGVPFDHDDVRVYVDTLFLEGALRPVAHTAEALRRQWVAVGIQAATTEDQLRRLVRTMDAVDSQMPTAGARYQEWLAFAYLWAELAVLWYRDGTTDEGSQGLSQRFGGLRDRLDATFLAWVLQRYRGLHNQPAVAGPVMLHHVPRYLAHQRESLPQKKVALLLVDGLALDQWVVVRETLLRQRPSLRLHEGATFAWVPTITSVSRQATFSGKVPAYFAGSIYRTDRDAAHWTQFWIDQGLSPAEIAYVGGLGEDTDRVRVEAVAEQAGIRALGLVIDKVDKIMHGMQLGTSGMHSQMRQWASLGFLATVLDLLLSNDFMVFLTSDHGNIEATGGGAVSEGSIAEVRGERVRIYPDQALREHVKTRFPDAIEWPPIGLPPDVLSLLAADRKAFIHGGDRTVTHGGVAIEELVVPLIRIDEGMT